MAQLQFKISELDTSYTRDGEGAAFQQFVFEVNDRRLPHLHPYPAGGKDGGIDHLTDEAGKPRVAIECKFCGTDGIEEVRKRWRVTKGNLESNLSLPDGSGQAQYRPWYRTDEPIARYIFATSARLENAARVDELRDEIRDFFHGLAAKHVHLAHLGDIIVEVHDWNYIEGQLPAFLRFRWFLQERPAGLRLLATEDESATGFRAWLRNSTLPFYSRAQHFLVDPAPPGGDLLDEKALLSALSIDTGTLGLVLVGRGGVGKTRLALEIGHTAIADGWTVWVVRRRLKPETIDQLAARMDVDTRVLLIFDYVETHPEFTNVIQHLADIVDDTDHCLRYIATCRSSYYNAIKGAERQHVVAISAAKSTTEEWQSRYSRATVAHILNHAGIPINEQNIRACHDLPVLAAFLHWLHFRGRTEELKTLLGEEDFGRWVIHRVQLSFPERRLDHSLARLIALFPIPAVGRSALTEDERELFYCLEQDGWIERADDPTAGAVAWQTAHDVLADRVALEWLQTIGPAAYEWCAELLGEAIRFHALPSALRSLQRLAEYLSIGETEWETLLVTEIRKAQDEWRPLRVALLCTSLLSAPSRARLLALVPDVFAGAEVDADLQSALGDLLRHLVETKSVASLGVLERKTLFDWVHRAIPHQRGLPFLRAWAVRVAPEVFQAETLAFLEARADNLSTQYVLDAWIYAGLETDLIANAVREWCFSHANKKWFSFLAEAWLSGGGSRSTIQPFLPVWFAQFLPTLLASFVFSSWLEHANAPEVVRDAVATWLATELGKSPEASHVLGRWLEHANEPGMVKDAVTTWLATELGKSPEARFVLGPWLEHANEPGTVKDAVTSWLATEHGKSLEASHVLGSWLEHAHAPQVVRDAVITWLATEHGKSPEARFVLGRWLEHANEPGMVKDAVSSWLATEHGKSPEARFVLGPWLEHANEPGMVKDVVTSWLATEHGKSLEASHVLGPWLEHANAPQVVRDAVITWLATEHGKSLEASHVLGPWLEHAHAPQVVRDAVITWLATEHGKSAEAEFVLAAWLKHANEPGMVKDAVSSWLATEHGISLAAQFILSAWLDYAKQPEMVKDAVTTWLATEHGKSMEASFVLRRWLKHANAPAVVKDAVITWLATEHGKSREAGFVLGPWLKHANEPGVVMDAMITWLATEHGKSREAAFVLSACLQVNAGGAEVKNAVIQWCDLHANGFHVSMVLESWLKNRGELERIRPAMIRWLNACSSSDNVSFVLCAWLNAGGDPTAIAQNILSFLASKTDAKGLAALRKAWSNVTKG